ncbi:radical SAM protein [Thermophilibacter provencensis]|uniref:radical SAM protein n=1 Tax=Thermophilibacter provencensis TaxID=1852386 RepID=UPI003AA7DEB2
MRLADHVELFSLGGIPMAGNLETGGVIGLTRAGEALCRKMSERDVTTREVPAECESLVEHLQRGGYLASSERPSTGRGHVRSAYLHVTQRCNLRCKFCYSEGDDRNLLPDPSAESLARAIGLLASLGTKRLVISGGEPFLRDDLPDIARAASMADIEEIVVLTNGLLVSEKNVASLAGVVSCVGVAFDGCSNDAVAHLRGGQNFDQLVSAVKTIRTAGIAARVLPTIHGRNLGDMGRYRDVARKLGASVGFSMLTAPLSKLGEFAIDDGQLADLGRAAADDGLDYGDDLHGGGSLGVRRSCGAGVRALSVAADGTVYPCHMLHDRRLAMGDAFSDDAEKIMGGEVARLFASLDARTFDSCDACSRRPMCGGGCRARALMSTGSLTGRDPYCALSSAYYDRLGERLRRRFAEGR